MEAASAKLTAEGVILGYRLGGGRQYTSHVLVKLFVDRKEVGKFIGGIVRFTDRHGNTYKGRILRRHGAKGSVVLVRFKPNIPGQAITARVVAEAPEKQRPSSA
ncbi:50S ribosomal protein L35ae [Stetteria hydrogenophila]